MGNESNRVTLKDIALEANVSVMTVSKVLNGKSGISKETAEKIREVAKRLHYRPNHVAKSLRASETYTLGIVVSDSSELVFSKVLRGIEDAASAEGYRVMLINTDQKVEKEKLAIETLLGQRIDGLILAAPLLTSRDDLTWVKAFGTPIVMLMRSGAVASVDSVGNDNINGGYSIVNYLFETGSRDIVFISLPEESQSGRERLIGYKQAFREHGLQWDNEKVYYCRPHIEDGLRSANQLLDTGFKKGAICCGCDLIAIGVIRAILQRGLRVPKDIRVTGYDDVELADYLEVPLTTMRQPKYEIGKEGVSLLINRLQNADGTSRQMILKSELIVRKST